MLGISTVFLVLVTLTLWLSPREKRFRVSCGSFVFVDPKAVLSCLLCVLAVMWRCFSWTLVRKVTRNTDSDHVIQNCLILAGKRTYFLIIVSVCFCLLSFFWYRVWLCSSGQPETMSSKLSSNFLPWPPESWDYRPVPLHLQGLGFL